MKKFTAIVLSIALLLITVPASQSTTLSPMPYGKIRFWNTAGTAPLASGTVCTYEPGTSTAKVTYTDYSGGTANQPCVTLDTRGEAAIWLNGYYKVIVKDSSGVTQWTADYVSSAPASDTVVFTEWQDLSNAPVYLSATTFYVTGDYRTTFEAGRRIKLTDGSSTLYGSIVSSAYATYTTVTVVLDSGSLTSGLSAVAVSIQSITNPAFVVPRSTLTLVTAATTTLNATHQIVHCNSATPITVALPTASTVATSLFTKKYVIRNVGAGVCTVSGTIDSISSPVLAQGQEITIYSDGTSWYFDRTGRFEGGQVDFKGSTISLTNSTLTSSGTNTLTGTWAMSGVTLSSSGTTSVDGTFTIAGNISSSATTTLTTGNTAFAVAAGTAPFTIPTTTTEVTNLNADYVGGFQPSQSPTANQIPTLTSNGSYRLGAATVIASANTSAVIQFGSDSVANNNFRSESTLNLSANITFDGSDYRYIDSAAAKMIQVSRTSAAPSFYTAPSGTAGDIVSFTTYKIPVVVGSTAMFTKIIDIGDWNMDSTASVTITHGLTLSKIRTVSVMVQGDDDLATYPRLFPDTYYSGTNRGFFIGYIDATSVYIERLAASIFDATGFDDTSYNRGWITITYTE